MVAIGHLGKDVEVKYHGTESVLNFSVAHTDKWRDNGIQKEKTTWVSCSWWVENTNIAQYMRKGTLVYVEGIPEAKIWKKKEGEPQPYLNLRVFSLQLLSSGRRDDSTQNQSQAQSAPASSDQGYKPFGDPPNASTDDSDLPF